jgi:hypothetical protein
MNDGVGADGVWRGVVFVASAGVDHRHAHDDAHERLLVVRLPDRQGAGQDART